MNELFPMLPANGLTAPFIALGIMGLFLIIGGIVANIAVFGWFVATAPSVKEMGKRIHRRPWDWQDVALITAVLGLLHLSLFCCVYLRSLVDESGETLFALSIAAQTIIFHGGGYILVADRLRQRGVSWKEAFGIDFRRVWPDIAKGLIFYLAAMPFVIGSALIYQLILFLLDYTVEPQDVIKMFLSSDQPLYLKLYIALLATAVAPFAEELLFRGVALPSMIKQVKTLPGILLVSLLFAAIHFSVPALVPLFVIATAFSLAYVVSGSLLVPIVMHAAFNTVSLIMLALASVADMDGLTGMILR